MDLYHSWFYTKILNTNWFVWGIVSLVLGGNIFSPIILWLLMSGKNMPFLSKKIKESNQG